MSEESFTYKAVLIAGMVSLFVVPILTFWICNIIFIDNAMISPMLSIASLFFILISMCVIVCLNEQPIKKSKKLD